MRLAYAQNTFQYQLTALKGMRDILLNSVTLNPKDRLDAELLSLALTS